MKEPLLRTSFNRKFFSVNSRIIVEQCNLFRNDVFNSLDGSFEKLVGERRCARDSPCQWCTWPSPAPPVELSTARRCTAPAAVVLPAHTSCHQYKHSLQQSYQLLVTQYWGTQSTINFIRDDHWKVNHGWD